MTIDITKLAREAANKHNKKFNWEDWADIDKAIFESFATLYRAAVVAELVEGAGEITDKHDHPEPHTMKWTNLEMGYINKRVAGAVAAEKAKWQKYLLDNFGLEAE